VLATPALPAIFNTEELVVGAVCRTLGRRHVVRVKEVVLKGPAVAYVTVASEIVDLQLRGQPRGEE